MLVERIFKVLRRGWGTQQSINVAIKTTSNKNCSLRKIHTTNSSFNYLSLETKYARSVLGNSTLYSNSLATSLSTKDKLQIDEIDQLINKKWISMTNSEILENFETLSHYAFKNLTSMNEYSGVLEVISSRCSDFSDSEIHHLLSCLELWTTREIKPYYYNSNPINDRLFRVLDDLCTKRLPNWTVDEIFLINDHFYKLKLTKKSKFCSQSLKSMEFEKFTAANAVQYAFFVKVFGRLDIDLQKYQYCLEKLANKFTVEELGIIAMTFFRYEKAINSNRLVSLFIEKLKENIESVSDISLAAILKILRYSIDLLMMEKYNTLLEVLVKQVPVRTIQTVNHIAHMQGRLLLHNDKLIAEILKRYEKEMKNARVKDIERIVFTLYILNYNPEVTPFYSTAIKELLDPHRIEEISKHPQSLVYTVLFMLQVNFYSEEALKVVMDPNFIKRSCKSNIKNLNREYMIIDYCLEIEHPQYKGPRLQREMMNFLLMKFGAFSQVPNYEDSQSAKLMNHVIHSCKNLLGMESAVHVDSLLPYLPKRDIIICQEALTGRFLRAKDKLSKVPLGNVKYAPCDGNRWYVLLIGSHNFFTRNTGQPTGALALQIRHLKLMGYIPVVIPYSQWLSLKYPSDKRKYLINIFDQ